jgi:hypothetical protein
MMNRFAKETEMRIKLQKERLVEYKKNLLIESLKQRESPMPFPYQSKRVLPIEEPNWKIQPFPHPMRWVTAW